MAAYFRPVPIRLVGLMTAAAVLMASAATSYLLAPLILASTSSLKEGGPSVSTRKRERAGRSLTSTSFAFLLTGVAASASLANRTAFKASHSKGSLALSREARGPSEEGPK